MSRIQVLPLPPIKAGEYEQTPFVLIFDQIADDRGWTQEHLEALRQQTGAAAVWAHADTLDAPGQLELTDEQRDTLLAYITEPRRVMLGSDFPSDVAFTDPGRIWAVPDATAHTKPVHVDELPAEDQWLKRRYDQRYTERPRIIGVLRGAHPHLGHVRHEPSEDGAETVTDVEIHLDHDGYTILSIAT